MTRVLVGVVVLWAGVVAAEPFPRFFIMGTGRLAITNGHTGEKLNVRYRGEDGTYDKAALGRIRHLFRSRGDGGETDISLRLIEILSHVQRIAGDKPLVLVSGYRSPEYNKDLKGQGRKVASGSLHTEGLAADLAFPRAQLPKLWQQVRALDCCGAGYYAKEGFLHVDVGQSRFWEAATSKVDQNLSAGNARLFARTEFDRYAVGETVRTKVHALTVPPVGMDRAVRWGDGDTRLAIKKSASACLILDGSGASFDVTGPASAGSAPLEINTCEPRYDQTPTLIQSNVIDIH